MKGALKEAGRSAQALQKNGAAYDSRALFDPMEIANGVFWPTLLFVFVFRLNISEWRHYYAFEVFILTAILPVLYNLYRSHLMYKQLRKGTCRRWKLVMTVVLWLVIFYANLQADKGYWRFSRSYFDFQSMASYVNIDPSMDRGQTYMDAGQVYFKEGTQVEISKAIAFQEDEIYCVAPIVQQTLDSGGDKSGKSLTGNALKMPASGTVDFWAVGINCCDPSGLNFKCGESKNPLARAGIRELRDDTRPFFYMAVQEWTAWLRMPAKHPLFFHWVQDPLVRVEQFWFDAMMMFYLDSTKCFIGTLAGTMIFQYVFYNLGV